MHETIISTSVGRIYLAVEGRYLIALRNHTLPTDLASGTEEEQHTMQEVICELEEYLSGSRRSFGVMIRIGGTAFQQAVWQAAMAVPYGRQATYTDIARSIGRPQAVRAVGQALGKNPILIIVPCHRIVGKNGIPRGYAGGAMLQAALLQIEARCHAIK